MSEAGFIAHSTLAAARDLNRTAAVIATEQDVLIALFRLRREVAFVGNNLNQVAKALNSGTAPEELDDTIAAVLRAAQDIHRVTSHMTNPEGAQTV